MVFVPGCGVNATKMVIDSATVAIYLETDLLHTAMTCDVFMHMKILRKVLKYSCERMVVSTKSRGRGSLGHITYFDSTQFTVYNGVTHDPQNISIVE